MVERELVLSVGGSQWGDGTSLLMDYDQEQMGESEGVRGGDKLTVGGEGGGRKRKEKEKNVQYYNISHLPSPYSCH